MTELVRAQIELAPLLKLGNTGDNVRTRLKRLLLHKIERTVADQVMIPVIQAARRVVSMKGGRS